MTLPLSHTDLADPDGLVASIGALLPKAAFSRIEQVVLDIAWLDAHHLAPSAGRVHRLLHHIFGGEPPLPFGSERLEALRQYGMQLRCLGSRAVPAATTAALMAAGYSAEQISVLHMTLDAFSGGLIAYARKGGK
jgi:hypothetical protein